MWSFWNIYFGAAIKILGVTLKNRRATGERERESAVEFCVRNPTRNRKRANDLTQIFTIRFLRFLSPLSFVLAMFSRSSNNHQLKLQPRPPTEFRVLPKFEEERETPKKQRSKVKQVLNYLSDHFCPWDYDLYRPDITFFQVWNVTSEEESIPLRFSVTYKPLSSQAKFSLRARLAQLGPEGFFFVSLKSASIFYLSLCNRQKQLPTFVRIAQELPTITMVSRQIRFSPLSERNN